LAALFFGFFLPRFFAFSQGAPGDVKNGVVTLKGEVPSQAKRQQVEKLLVKPVQLDPFLGEPSGARFLTWTPQAPRVFSGSADSKGLRRPAIWNCTF
jgi:hypothetical protein